MRGPLPLDGFAELMRTDPADIARFRDAGLLDPEGDGLFDEYDALRLHYVITRLDAGRSLEELAALAAQGKADVPFFSELLYPTADAIGPDEAAERLGFTPEQLRRLSEGAGFPIRRALDASDLSGLSSVKAMLDAGMPLDALVEGSRVLGDAMRRFAQTEASLVHRHIHEPMIAAGASETDMTLATNAVLEQLQPAFERVMLFVHQQYLLRAVLEDVVLHMAGDPSRSAEATIVFVDISSFTSLAAVHGDAAAAEIIDRFDTLTRTTAVEHGGVLVNQVGDAFMLSFDDAGAALRFCVALADGAAQREGFPALRAGVHRGPVLLRLGDLIGNTVNLAARIVAAAGPGEILFSEQIAAAAGDAGVEAQPIGARLLRGAEEALSLYRVQRTAGRRDPVCGTTTGPGALRLTRDGVEHAFCSEDCLRRFVTEPQHDAMGGSA